MPNQLISTDLEELKLGFLEAYKKLKIPKDACEEMSIKRSRLNGWLQGDQVFREAYSNVQKDIVDEVDKMLMKHSGLLKWTKQERDRGLYKWSNMRSLELIRKANTASDGEASIKPTMMPLKINGLSSEDLKALVTSDKNGAESAKIVQAEIVPEGVPTKKATPPVLADLVKKRAQGNEDDG